MATPTKRTKAPAKRSPAPKEEVEVPARVARRERRRQRSRDEILDAARVVLLRDGIASITVDAVAREVGVTKTAIYYYFASKDALLFELVYSTVADSARATHEATSRADDGAQALRAIVTETVNHFAPRLDDFRLAFLHAQVAGPGSAPIDAEQFARLRPLNDLIFGRAAQLLTDEHAVRPNRAGVEPRLLAFLANVSALGLLTMKGMVENVNDPLRYSDAQLTEALSRVFEAAAGPAVEPPRPRRK